MGWRAETLMVLKTEEENPGPGRNANNPWKEIKKKTNYLLKPSELKHRCACLDFSSVRNMLDIQMTKL